MTNEIGRRAFLAAAATGVAATGVAAIGEGGLGAPTAPQLASPLSPTDSATPAFAPSSGSTVAGATYSAPEPGSMTAAESARFLSQATFGPTASEIEALRSSSFEAWLEANFAMPITYSALKHVRRRRWENEQKTPPRGIGPAQFYEAFWRDAVIGPDQLRHRMRFALSQIFVVSFARALVDLSGMGAYYDLLGQHAFGNFRDLLEAVTLNPMMGRYLTHLGNAKEDPNTGRAPDENYAREVMQLMSIGLVMLNPDGTPQTDSTGNTIPTYDFSDISGLAKVFTGWSWYSPNLSTKSFQPGYRNGDLRTRPMIPYPRFHSTSEKKFLGVTIPASSIPDPRGDLKIALDTIFNHPNVGPFIGKQLIQRFVTSNPTPDYVARVAAAFANNGQGVRGDLRAVLRAILLDPEARDMSAINNPTFGKLREPVIRLTHMLRACGATSRSKDWNVNYTGSSLSLAQCPFVAPSVFNFFRPDFSTPNSKMSRANLVAPEFQIVDEITVAGYANKIRSVLELEIESGDDVRMSLTEEQAIAGDPDALIDRLNYVLLNGTMSPSLRQNLQEAIGSIAVSKSKSSQSKATKAALRNRARLAVLITMVSPDYLIQR